MDGSRIKKKNSVKVGDEGQEEWKTKNELKEMEGGEVKEKT